MDSSDYLEERKIFINPWIEDALVTAIGPEIRDVFTRRFYMEITRAYVAGAAHATRKESKQRE